MSFLIEIASVIDRDDLIAEIWWKNQMLAEIRQDAEIRIEIYPSESANKVWDFKLIDFLKAIEDAKNQLIFSTKN